MSIYGSGGAIRVTIGCGTYPAVMLYIYIVLWWCHDGRKKWDYVRD